MDKIIDHLFVFEGGDSMDIQDFPGNYTQFREIEKTKKQNKSIKNTASVKKIETKTKKEGKITYAERIELESLEVKLEELEAQKEELAETLSNFGDDHEKLIKVGKEMELLMQELDDKTNRWIELSEKDT
jgi:ATP-binding cassette subfamily F protein uup